MTKRNIFKTIGATNHRSDGELSLGGRRVEHDFYATDPIAIDRLESKFCIPQFVWECACGTGCLSERLKDHGHDVVSTDLVDRGYGTGGVDFLGGRSQGRALSCGEGDGENGMNGLNGDDVVKNIVEEMRRRRERGEEVAILTNPPFLYCTDFVLRGLELLPVGGYLIYLMRTLCLEGVERYEKIYRLHRPKGIYQMIGRLLCAKNGDFFGSRESLGKGAQAYAWYVWKKGVTRGTVVDWI